MTVGGNQQNLMYVSGLVLFFFYCSNLRVEVRRHLDDTVHIKAQKFEFPVYHFTSEKVHNLHEYLQLPLVGNRDQTRQILHFFHTWKAFQIIHSHNTLYEIYDKTLQFILIFLEVMHIDYRPNNLQSKIRNYLTYHVYLCVTSTEFLIG